MEQNNGGPDILSILHMKDMDDIRKELDDLKEEKRKQVQIKKEEITLAQQLLLLHYAGLLNKIDQTTKGKSLLLSKILNRSKDNIKKNLTYINSPKISHSKIKNVKNLELVFDIFNDLKMTEVADKVKLDLNKIKEV